ncbi:MAG: hypothetical protein DU480_07520 [Nitrosomonas sp.]
MIFLFHIRLIFGFSLLCGNTMLRRRQKLRHFVDLGVNITGRKAPQPVTADRRVLRYRQFNATTNNLRS